MPSEAALGPPLLGFLSDYGLADELVGVCHAVMLRITPGLRIVDITHEVPPHDVRAGALTLARAAQYLVPATLLAVVDPGVGTERRPVAVETEHGHLVGPDNGLLAPAVAMLGGATRAVALTNEEYQLPSPAPTFAGRDVFAPAAANLAGGTDLADLGDEIATDSMLPGTLPLSRVDEGVLRGEVLWVDRFGNAQLNVDPGELEELGVGPGGMVEVRTGDAARVARWVTAYGDARPSELVVLVDSYGLVSLALDRASAAVELGVGPGDAVALGPVAGG